MADGSQRAFPFPRTPASRLRPGEIVVDLFAGGGGASTALEQALGRPVDIAINHNPWAVSMHAANHPLTTHLCQDVWEADPRNECAGKAGGWLHASPDCTHFSQAKGGQPRSRATRSLSWVVLRWAGTVRPRIISLENVKEILKWGPLVAKRCKATGRVFKLDGTLAAPRERVAIDQQFLIPDKRHAGRTWKHFVRALHRIGYVVEWRRLKACDYGAGTSRERLFLCARRDGEAVQWPAPSHGPGAQLPHVPAAACIDWTIPCPSIFTRKKPLADATLRRIARGVKRYVVDAAEPFIVENVNASGRDPRDLQQPVAGQRMDRRASACAEGLRGAGLHGRGEQSATMPGPVRGSHGSVPAGDSADPAAHAFSCAPILTEHANSSNARSWRADEPLRTQCAGVKGGHFALAAATLVQAAFGEGKPGGVQRRGSGAADIDAPLGTVTASGSGGFALAAATLVQTGYGEREGQEPRSLNLDKPLGTVVAGGVKHAVASASLVKFRGASDGAAITDPLPTITSGAGAARPAGAAHAMGVMTAFLEQANGGFYEGAGNDVRKPVPTICAEGSHQRLVTGELAQLAPEHEAGALRVAAFLVKYYGTALGVDIAEPLDTITTRDRLALVTVHVRGVPYVIVDIGLRMLKPHELFAAQGFPRDYIIDRTADGRAVSVSRSVAMVGNSVSPPPLRAIAEANLDRVHAMAVAA